MKTSIILSGIFAICTLIFTTSCEETVDLPEENIVAEQFSLNEIKSDILQPPHDEGSSQIRFDIQVTDCFSGGQTLEVIIDSPDQYSFLWEVNDSHGGHTRSVECVCGETARVRVMSLADGESAYRTVDLLPCEVDDSF